MHLPVRFVITQVLIMDSQADEDGKINGVDADEKWVQTSIDLWTVQEISEGWEKGTIVLTYFDGEEKTVRGLRQRDVDGEYHNLKGTFSQWYDLHTQAKMDELQIIRLPALN
jgi:hypothetical protein